MHLVSPSAPIHRGREPLIIAAVAFALRILVALLAYGRRDIVAMLWPRGVEALGIARSLLNGAGFSSPFSVPTGPTAFLTPVYPLMLAAIERVFGVATIASAWAILFLQCFCSALTCVAIYYLCESVFDNRIAKLAAWLWALFPYAILLPTNIIWESSLSALALTCGVWFLLRALRSGARLHWAWLGFYWTIACLLNAALMLILPAYLLFLSARNRNLLPRATLCALIFVAGLLPWSLRNYVVFHKLFPLRDNFALELWLGNHEGATTRFTPEIHPAFSAAEIQHYRAVGEIRYMAEKRDIALAFINSHPLIFARNTVTRFFAYWLVNLHALWYLVPALSVAGFIGLALILARSHAFAWIFWIPLLIYPLPYYITHADLRYQHPLQPLLAILAAYAFSKNTARRPESMLARETVEV